MNWLAIADINEFEIEAFGTQTLVKCPEHGTIGKLTASRPIRLREVFREIAEHVDERHRESS